MILYKKTFPLGKDMSFFQYITALRKAYFPNFVLAVDKIAQTENYRVQIFFTAPLWKWGLANIFAEGVFLKECLIQYSTGEGYFTLQASSKIGNLVYASFYVISSVALLFFLLFTIITTNTFSFTNIFILAMVTFFLLTPFLIYFRDKKLLDKVGSLGREIEGKQNII